MEEKGRREVEAGGLPVDRHSSKQLFLWRQGCTRSQRDYTFGKQEGAPLTQAFATAKDCNSPMTRTWL